MNIHQTKIKVRYAETDQMGVVYHGNYAQYLEIGRLEWLSALGISYKEMEENQVMLPVVSLSINYKKPACYDDILTVTTTLVKQPKASIDFDYEIHNEMYNARILDKNGFFVGNSHKDLRAEIELIKRVLYA